MTNEEIFAKAISLSGSAREAFLDGVYYDCPQDRAQMEKMLAAHEDGDSLLASHEPAATEDIAAEPKLDLGETVGPYKLLQRIGEGGMGAVYMAEQLQPIRRVVALKVVKAGLDSKQVVARFEAERQTLALMDHPNIAKVLDAGETDRGEPYFVMELVKGVPLTEYCDTNRITTRQRIQLVADVCNAVQHAHQKGIIHRDLKPSNILVAQYDDRPVPKVIDFGVAKATHQKLTEKTLYTQLGQIVGTLEYMSPEQAVLNQLDVDTRTDVYSLGVILYELLVGETPLASKELRSQGLEQILRTIREQEPARPSVRLSSQGQAASQTAAYRSTDTQALSRVLRGDLDWIVMKALEKDRARRYESASRLAGDLSNYLSGKTVEARPPTVAYRLKKTWQRNRLLLTSMAVVVIALMLATAMFVQGIIESKHSRNALREELFQRVVENLLSGDQLELRTLELVHHELPPDRVEFVEAMQANNRGDHLGVIKHLDKAILLAPGVVAYEALRLRAHLLQGDPEKLNRGISDLQKRNRTTRLDSLFVGLALTYEDPALGIQIIEDASEGHNSLFVQHALSALYGHKAIKEKNLADAVKALELSESVYRLAPDNGDFLGSYLWHIVVNIQVNRALGEPENKKLAVQAEGLCNFILAEESNHIGKLIAGYYFLLSNQLPKALEAFENAGDEQTGFFPVYIAALKLLNDQPLEDSMAILKNAQRDSTFNLSLYAEARLLIDGNSPDIAILLAELAATRRPVGAVRTAWTMPESLIGIAEEDAASVKVSRARLREGQYVHEWERDILQFLATPEEGMAAAVDTLIHKASSQHNLAEAYRVIGLRYYSQRKKASAIRYLRMAGNDTAATVFPGSVWARVEVSILENMELPPIGDKK